jgi:hypothetical protein
MDSILNVKVEDVVKYTAGNASSFFRPKDLPPHYDDDDPYGTVVEVGKTVIPSVKVRWLHDNSETWVFRSSLQISSERNRQSDLGWARSYYRDQIRDAQRQIEYATDRLRDLPC